MKTGWCGLVLWIGLLGSVPCALGEEESSGQIPENFRRENLIAWCIVPFDASGRGPEARAAMVKELGIRRIAYDWRREHVPTFRAELEAYEAAGLEMFAFWKGDESAYALFKEMGLRPQVWRTLRDHDGATEEEKIANAVEAFLPLAEELKAGGLPLVLYNHGGRGGEPENLIAVCEGLRARGFEEVGIVYNFHHAHHRIDSWSEDLALLKPYLLCLNLNGMLRDGPEMDKKILSLGKGEEEEANPPKRKRKVN